MRIISTMELEADWETLKNITTRKIKKSAITVAMNSLKSYILN